MGVSLDAHGCQDCRDYSISLAHTFHAWATPPRPLVNLRPCALPTLPKRQDLQTHQARRPRASAPPSPFPLLPSTASAKAITSRASFPLFVFPNALSLLLIICFDALAAECTRNCWCPHLTCSAALPCSPGRLHHYISLAHNIAAQRARTSIACHPPSPHALPPSACLASPFRLVPLRPLRPPTGPPFPSFFLLSSLPFFPPSFPSSLLPPAIWCSCAFHLAINSFL